MTCRLSVHPCITALLVAAAWAPASAAAQRRAELELERRDLRTTSRIEVYDGTVPVLRAERELDDDPFQRLGVRIPGSVLDVDGYVSLFLEDRSDRTDFGAAFEIGRGVPMLAGSVERGEDHYAGLYLKLRSPDAEIAFGGGDRNGDAIGHAALYVKGARWSAALGGARGSHGVDFGHFAATWHPTQRGAAPGARLRADRRGGDRYYTEFMVADRANFDHFAVWGQFGMDQFPHRKTFEAVGDITRYVRPPRLLHEYTSGAGVLTGRYEVRNGIREITLDARVFPARAFSRLRPERRQVARAGLSGYIVRRVLPTIMVGGFRMTRAGANTWVGEIGFPPISFYAEVPTREGAHPYVFVQYRRTLRF